MIILYFYIIFYKFAKKLKMGNNEKTILGLSKSLFWDTDTTKLDPKKHKAYIIDRVLARGTLEEFKIIKDFYGKTKIKNVAKKLRYMNNIELNFCSIYFKLPITQFRCYIYKQLNQSHWSY